MVIFVMYNSSRTSSGGWGGGEGGEGGSSHAHARACASQ